jgi:ATPase subunit of ABC transporter with duplicated ATPase domains
MRDELQFRILISIRDDEKSRQVIQSVVDSNKELSTTLTSQAENIMKRQDAASSLASRHHVEVLQAISNQRIEKYSIQDVTRMIMDKLHFTRKDDRYDDIVAAHQKTFDWALESHADDTISWPSLAHWLRQDDGVYWISGKAGSGKSTLMKYLYQDP